MRYWHHQNAELRRIYSALVLVAGLTGCALAFGQNGDLLRCAYDPESGQPNPLGMRSFIVAMETESSDTEFRYESFPHIVPGGQEVTLSQRRTLVFHGLRMEAARARLRENLSYYHALTGSEDTAGFSSYDEAMACEPVNP